MNPDKVDRSRPRQLTGLPTIVVAASADAQALLALQKRAYQSEARLYDDWTIPPLQQSLESLHEEIRSITVLKAVAGDTIVGSVRAGLRDKTCLVGKLIVEPALLLAVEASFPQAEAFELFTGSRSEDNIRLYRRHGYRESGMQRISEQLTFVFMRKPAATAACTPFGGRSGDGRGCIVPPINTRGSHAGL